MSQSRLESWEFTTNDGRKITVELEIDFNELVGQMGRRALRNKMLVSTGLNRAIVARITRVVGGALAPLDDDDLNERGG